MGVRGKMWRVLRSMYAKVESCVLINEELTQWFRIFLGVRQGCVASPLLFSIFLDGLVREIEKMGLGVETRYIFNLFAAVC